jgi:hypothetical protein
MVPQLPKAGFEPATCALRGRCSGHLSYLGATIVKKSAYRNISSTKSLLKGRLDGKAQLACDGVQVL